MVVGPARARPRARAYAEAFDVDWDVGGGRIRIPVLGERATTCGAADDRRTASCATTTTGTRSRPAPPTTGRTRVEVHARQHYELVDWRRGRRRAQLPPLLRGEHPGRHPGRGAVGVRRVARRDPRWVRRGPRRRAAGRPSGRPARPGRRTSTASPRLTGGAYVLVEKILEGDEPLPDFWATAGTTGLRRARRLRPGARRPGRASSRSTALADAARGRPRRLARPDPHDQARGRRRDPALRGAPSRAGGRVADGRGRRPPRRRGRRAAHLLPRLPHLPARRRDTSTRRRPRRPARRPDLAHRGRRRRPAAEGRSTRRSRSGSSRPPAW